MEILGSDAAGRVGKDSHGDPGAEVEIETDVASVAGRRGRCDLTLDQGIRLEEDLYALLQTTADRAEGVRAFLDKRKPLFRGT